MNATITRRQTLVLLGRAGLAGILLPSLVCNVQAGPKEARARLAELTDDIEQQKGRVEVILPEVTDQARFVPIRVRVDSPMNDDDFVREIHIVAERNPTPDIASFYLSPANGKAEVSARIRLLQTQVVIAAAIMSDGGVYIGKGRSKITGGAGACG